MNQAFTRLPCGCGRTAVLAGAGAGFDAACACGARLAIAPCSEDAFRADWAAKHAKPRVMHAQLGLWPAQTTRGTPCK